MISSILFALLSVLAVYPDIITLDSSNYDELIKKGHIFVKYFSPTCGHCQAVAPTYVALADSFKKYGERITFAEVDCKKQHSICDKADIRGYPTFLYYAGGEVPKAEYNGDRSLDDFSEFVAGKIGVYYAKKPKATKELTPDNWNETVMDLTKNVLVAFTAPWCGHCKRLKPQLEMAAQSFKPEENVTFCVIDAEKYSDFCEPFQVNGYPTIKFFPAASEKDAEVQKAYEAEQEKIAAAAAVRKVREDEIQAIKDAAQAENATEEAKNAFTPELDSELRELKKLDVVDEYTPKVFRKGANPIEPFEGSRSAAGIVDYINRRVGTMRAVGGGVDQFAGIVREIAEPMVRYVHAVTGTPLPKEPEQGKTNETADSTTTTTTTDTAATTADATTTETPSTDTNATDAANTTAKEVERVPPPTVEEAKKVVEDILSRVPSHFVVQQYHRYMDTFESKGLDYIDKERERLSALLENPHFTDQKQMELTVRKNVLSLFLTI